MRLSWWRRGLHREVGEARREREAEPVGPVVEEAHDVLREIGAQVFRLRDAAERMESILSEIADQEDRAR